MKLQMLRFSLPLALLAAWCFGAWNATAQNQPSASAPSYLGQAFDTPQQAAEALIKASNSYDVAALMRIFGPEGKSFVSSADPVRDKSLAAQFASEAREKTEIEMDPQNKAKAVVSVGNENWPFPVPLVQKQAKWYFDSKQGRTEILYRRIGANELDAIQICRGFVEAQEDYASQIHGNSGVNQYAQVIMSTPGKRDGLYWQNEDGTPGGPISEAVANAIQEGYDPGKPTGYHGYYFKVLKGQGPAAPLGRLDYVIKGVMIGGFALLAFPAEYRVTGVKSFIVSYDGIVYQKDLGPDTVKVAETIDLYNPDKSWQRTDDQWPSDLSLGD